MNLARGASNSSLIPRWVRDELRWRRAGRRLLDGVDWPPTTFNEKVRYRMATDRREILTTFSDKVGVRDYVRERVGDHVLTRLYEVTSAPETLVRSSLPREFVLKASHGSGGMILVGDHVPRKNRLPRPPVGLKWFHVHPDSLEWQRLVDICRHWLWLRFAPHVAWAYSKVKPRILIEELLLSDGQVPKDYKFFVFGGNVELVQIDQDRFVEHRRNLYSPRWERLDAEYVYPRGSSDPKPAKLGEMIAVAESLGDQIDFVRVDLYNIGERIVFGEITAYPEGGSGPFDPPELDAKLGALWQLDASRRPRLLRRERSSPPRA
jgi:TupA-like ATPgrasp